MSAESAGSGSESEAPLDAFAALRLPFVRANLLQGPAAAAKFFPFYQTGAETIEESALAIGASVALLHLSFDALVLGMGAGRKVPSWDEAKQQFVPVTECYVTLSFDHRVLDGGAAGRLLQRIGLLMQEPEKL